MKFHCNLLTINGDIQLPHPMFVGAKLAGVRGMKSRGAYQSESGKTQKSHKLIQSKLP
jgi:hypothetical protein